MPTLPWRRLLVTFSTACLLLSLAAAASAQNTLRFGQIWPAIGQPGSLGVAGLDAMMEYCTGKRDPQFREDMRALVEKSEPARMQGKLIELYDRHFSEWQRRYSQRHGSKAETCNKENILATKSPTRSFWAMMAAKIGYPGF